MENGYGERNLLFLKEKGITGYIRLQVHEKRKTRAYQEDIGKYYNMKREVFEDEACYVCHDGRQLRHIRTERKHQDRESSMLLMYKAPFCNGSTSPQFHKNLQNPLHCADLLAGDCGYIPIIFTAVW